MPLTLSQVEELGGYKVLLSDPPWNYSNNGGLGAAENHYPTMKVADICALPVKRLAAKDAVLFMWATWPTLPDAFKVISAWGFEYKTLAFNWVKYHEESGKKCFGGGFWTRANTEPCFIAVRGEPPRRVNNAIRQLIEEEEALLAPRQEHSAKPTEARERIVQLMGDIPRIELFTRSRVEGWDCWGNQAPGGSDVDLTEAPRCDACLDRKYVRYPEGGAGSFIACKACKVTA